jgi:hypothetical protein
MESLTDEITVDAEDVDEQLMCFLQVFSDEAAVPAPPPSSTSPSR